MTFRGAWQFLLSLPNNLRFNFRYFPARVAWRLPVRLHHKVFLRHLGGAVRLEGPIVPGRVWIGFPGVGIFDERTSRSIWESAGTVTFRGTARLGHGTRISVGPAGVLTIGDAFTVTAETAIVCHRSVEIGERCLFSWQILVMDTDFHDIRDDAGNHVNPPEPVRFGDHVWVGCRCTVLKGAAIPADTVVAATSCITGAIEGTRQLIGGSPARVLRTGVNWEDRR
jgi:acetyltransferase-like isoleucine patch superfamily enzyme